jgi:transposase
MLNHFITGAESIYIACGITDFRKQTNSLVSIITGQFQLDPFREQSVFIFCNRKRDGIRVLRYDKNGFILASKQLLDGMKFQWPKTPDEVKLITSQQISWLLQGLTLEPKYSHHSVKIHIENTCF